MGRKSHISVARAVSQQMIYLRAVVAALVVLTAIVFAVRFGISAVGASELASVRSSAGHHPVHTLIETLPELREARYASQEANSNEIRIQVSLFLPGELGPEAFGDWDRGTKE